MQQASSTALTITGLGLCKPPRQTRTFWMRVHSKDWWERVVFQCRMEGEFLHVTEIIQQMMYTDGGGHESGGIHCSPTCSATEASGNSAVQTGQWRRVSCDCKSIRCAQMCSEKNGLPFL